MGETESSKPLKREIPTPGGKEEILLLNSKVIKSCIQTIGDLLKCGTDVGITAAELNHRRWKCQQILAGTF